MNFKKQFEDLPEFSPDHPNYNRLTNRTVASMCRQQSPNKIRYTPRQTKITESESDKTEADTSTHSSLDALAEAALQHNIETPHGGVDTEYQSRKVQEHRRILVMRLLDERGYFPSDTIINDFQQEHVDLFPTKNSLLLKIREVRQKCLNHPQASS